MMSSSNGSAKVMILIGEAFVAVDEEYATECMHNFLSLIMHSLADFPIIPLFTFWMTKQDCEKKQQVKCYNTTTHNSFTGTITKQSIINRPDLYRRCRISGRHTLKRRTP